MKMSEYIIERSRKDGSMDVWEAEAYYEFYGKENPHPNIERRYVTRAQMNVLFENGFEIPVGYWDAVEEE